MHLLMFLFDQAPLGYSQKQLDWNEKEKTSFTSLTFTMDSNSTFRLLNNIQKFQCDSISRRSAIVEK